MESPSEDDADGHPNLREKRGSSSNPRSLKETVDFQEEFEEDFVEFPEEVEEILEEEIVEVESQEETSGRARVSWRGIWRRLFRKFDGASDGLEEDFPEGWFNEEIHEKIKDSQELEAKDGKIKDSQELEAKEDVTAEDQEPKPERERESNAAVIGGVYTLGCGSNSCRDPRCLQTNQSESRPRGSPKSKVLRAKLKRGLTVDSGSHHNVMPKRLVRKSKIRESEFSRRGLHYVAANKGRIPNEGEVDFEFTTNEGVEESWVFQMAEVNKALASIADRVDNSYRVVFDKDDETDRDISYMLNKKTKQIIKMTRVGNVWVIEATVDIGNLDESFARRE